MADSTRQVGVPRLVVREADPALDARLAEIHRAGTGTQEWPGLDGRPIGFSGTFEGRCFIVLHRVATYLFDGDAGPVDALADPEGRREWIEDSYRRLALPLVLQARGTQVLHASAVETPAGLAILCGFSGAGKSTLAYGLGRRGYPVWADDAVAFRVAAGRVEAHPLPFRIRLLPDAAGYFSPSKSEFDGRKISLPEEGERRVRESRCIAAGFLLEAENERGGARARVESTRLSPTEAFRRVLQHGYFFHVFPEASAGYRQIVEEYLELAGQVPFYSLPRVEGREGLEARIAVADEVLANRRPEAPGPSRPAC